MKSTSSEISQWVGTEIDSNFCDGIIEFIAIDSRSIYDGPHTLFVAFKGVRQNGVQFIDEVIRKGVRNILLAHNEIDKSKYPGVNFFEVENVIEALQRIVSEKRLQYSLPIIGITGSNGKTIIKEWLSQLLSADFNIVKNPKSYNSQIGVPLSLWSIDEKNTLGIFEAGISKKDEMKKLEKMIRPTIGILTNLGEAHQSNFESLEQKLSEKLRLFDHSDVLIVKYAIFKQYPDQFLSLESRNSKLTLLTWDHSPQADIQVQFNPSSKCLELTYLNNRYSIQINQKDEIYIENISICLCLLLYLKIDIIKKESLIRSLPSIEMRLEKIEGIYDSIIINDSYNADIDSLKIALEFLTHQGGGDKSLILSEVEHLSNEQLIPLIQSVRLKNLILIGDDFLKAKEFYEQLDIQDLSFYSSTENFIKNFSHTKFRNQTILIKGSRKFEFDRITELYRKRSHTTYLKVHLNALKNNLNEFSKLIKPSTKMMVMLKAQSYGLGSLEIARLLESQRVDYFAVAYIDEAIELRRGGIQTPIMILNTELGSIDKLIENNLEPEVYSLHFLNRLVEKLNSSNQDVLNPLLIHLKIETGMNRLGIGEEEIDEVIHLIRSNTRMRVQSILSHLAASDDPNHDQFTKTQIEIFQKISGKIEKELGYSVLKHILNTGGILRHSDFQMDMVRLGIGLFGFDSTHKIQSKLLNTVSLISRVSQIKKVPKGSTIGYSRNGKADQDRVIAIVSIGYADGYNRKNGNGSARVLIKNQFFQTIGNVCMDMIMVDITNGNNIQEGDEVELIGDHISVEEMAEVAETIPYEIITSISERVQRVYWED